MEKKEKIEKIVVEKVKRLGEHTLAEFSEKLASASPTPGGGAAAAYTAALGLSCALMACNLTPGSEEMIKDLEAMRAYLVRQVDEDALSYQPLKKYLAMPEDEPGRADHLQAALRVACQIPTEVMYTAGRALELIAPLAESCAATALPDLGAGIELCRAAILTAQQSIFAKSASIKDEVFALTLRIECQKLREQYPPMADAALQRIAERIG